MLVVADGVGGWNNQGVDPGIYARFLCSAYLDLWDRAQVYYSENPDFFKSNPGELIIRASRNNRYAGSSTMSVVTLDGG